MATDLEDRLRSALRQRGDRITESTLLHSPSAPPRAPFEVVSLQSIPDRRGGHERSSAPWQRALLVAASVATIGVAAALGVIVAAHSSDHAQTNRSVAYAGKEFYASKRWRVVSVTTPSQTLTLPTGAGAAVTFTDHAVTGYDETNTLSGEYVADTEGFTVTGTGTTLALYAGHDPLREAVIHALAAVFFGSADGVTSPSGSHVQVSSDGPDLLIRAGNYQLRAVFAGPAPSDSPIPPTGSPTH